VFFAISAYMTLKGLFALWRTMALDPSASTSRRSARRPSDLPTILAGTRRGQRRTAVAAVRDCGGDRRVGARQPRFPRDPGDDRRRPRHRRRHRRRLVRVRSPRVLSRRIPPTLEEKFVATNSGRAESFSYTAPIAYLLELADLLDRQSRVLTFGIAGVLGMLVGAAAMAIATEDVPLGRLHDDGGSRQPCRGGS
jgi:hypothetical protein